MISFEGSFFNLYAKSIKTPNSYVPLCLGIDIFVGWGISKSSNSTSLIAVCKAQHQFTILLALYKIPLSNN